ncbi:putative Co/Zn/Cd efflux system membrane fusion protein [Labilithrix luteola]|uniref:Putative Co/Zn/Cd efflux system membrane fusion protein n=1 Tax=Labilithrix luteola TaxID=1391654 RepID=A0A0K1PSA8_9BACT|nr:efflux RND transporter periplasmic adaptor subunit [Labilithrix luteola]AKU96425.1 putative Co/Zn/Cd efflux system membrane fusion protein [Labilithrix luteola]
MNAHRWPLLFALLIGTAGCNHKANALTTPPGPLNEALLTQEQIKKMRIATAVVDLQDVDDTVLTTGKVAYDDQQVVHVFSPVAGKAVKVLAQLGNHVKKGDPLVVIESPDIGVATSDLSKAKADLIAAGHDYQRQKELLETHATSQKDFETAADNYRKAKAEVERAEQKARLFRQGDVTGQTYTLRSDLEGEVFMKAISPGMEIAGQYGGGTTELFTIGHASKVWVLADVFELDIRRVKLGAKVVVNVASWPERMFEGTVDWISGALDTNTHATKVRCTFDNSDGALKPEMFATMRISVDVKKAIAIPRSSVLRFGDQTVVFVHRGTKDGKESFERLPVTVDEGEGSEWLTVEHGLEKGDKIVTDGALLLSGML